MQEVERDFAETSQFTGLPTLDPNVREAMLKVKRHLFVSTSQSDYAYINHALPIARQQTISQPFIVALMTALLQPGPDHIVLEVGTGSGYQAAVLSLLTARLYSIERIAELAASAADRLRTLGYDNVEVRCGDGALGWPEHAPFDGIIVTAGADEVPPALCAQLKIGGRLVIPVGRGGLAGQSLQVLTKRADGSIEVRSVLPVAFVPLLAATA
jgi:protein-L-isoaspartate(D-aspartate) O-methyltransferase